MEQNQHNEIQSSRSSSNSSAIANEESTPSNQSYDLKESLAAFLTVITKSCRGQQNIEDTLSHAQKTLQRAERTPEKYVSLGKSAVVTDVAESTSMSSRAEEAWDDSDVDPDHIQLDSRTDVGRTAVGTASDRGKRAQRRQAEADGRKVPPALMVNRKPVLKEHKEEVTLKVRNIH